MINFTQSSHSQWWNSNPDKWSTGSQARREEDSWGSGQTVPGPDREDHDGEGPGGGEVLHPLQDREGGQRVQETQPREVFRRGENGGPVPDRENIPKGDLNILIKPRQVSQVTNWWRDVVMRLLFPVGCGGRGGGERLGRPEEVQDARDLSRGPGRRHCGPCARPSRGETPDQPPPSGLPVQAHQSWEHWSAGSLSS